MTVASILPAARGRVAMGDRGWSRMARRAAAAMALLALECGWAKAEGVPPPSAADYVRAAAESDAFEIQSAYDARAQSANPQVQTFAQHMISDHEKLRAALEEATAADGRPPPPPGMSVDQARLLGALQALRGAAFDRAYARQQVLGHVSTAAVTQTYADKGSDGRLRASARAALVVIRSHEAMARNLQDSVAGP